MTKSENKVCEETKSHSTTSVGSFFKILLTFGEEWCKNSKRKNRKE